MFNNVYIFALMQRVEELKNAHKEDGSYRQQARCQK